MKKILVLHTGGTISMNETADGQIVESERNPLLDAKIQSENNIELIVEDFCNLPSPQIKPYHMLALKNRCQKAFLEENIEGIVITHGTDTLEETAFFLDSTIRQMYPIVLTGAMRSSNEIGSDGVYNFLTAIRVASNENTFGKGVLVVMNDEIHTARYVTKTHTTNVSTFQTPTHGPLGLVTKKQIIFFQQTNYAAPIDVDTIEGNIPIIKAYAGMTDDIFNLLDIEKIDGLVIEALGAGNLPPEAAKGLQRIINAKIPVVLVSRCFNGISEPVYKYEGGGGQLADMGVLFCKEINSQKARLKLLLAYNAGYENEKLKDYIEN
ncbi:MULTISPECIES: asparaginase [unclassified Enterococcus]|uniref:asparaginase n=1 Tax=unclassified Enterococcus TaxID=2608891 RepID=UPI001557F7EE|nr:MULTISPECIES: asparaginase [unclassified Enterococcus]MBS7577995.1 asparaginase [Enterococcus sp. MMGLQ5-2]MBS7585315.1 asparaginase [Enterococcus sp. MMGLQ5-1]NPD13172.1 asparaginase [Enterococcus sp. MMGLQ5-1]NPD37826.1 asparaginase [Enterococcus sp. MMGLQ5-2]